MNRYYYKNSIPKFLTSNDDEIIGKLALSNEFPLEQSQRDSWSREIQLLKSYLRKYNGEIYFEYSIPRMGKRIDVLCLIGPVVFIFEFKIGEKHYLSSSIDQVMDYALDLKNFHLYSHDQYIAPILICTNAPEEETIVGTTPHEDKLLFPINSNGKNLKDIIQKVIDFVDGDNIEIQKWESGGYSPTPTIIEAALALYRGHSVEEISRSDASAINLSKTTEAISQIIEYSHNNNQKSICFITGVPGAGKTLVGLNIANNHLDKSNALYSVYLSGNGPLVSILREALARDKVKLEKSKSNYLKIGKARSEVKAFIQNVHNFRDECLIDEINPPIEHIALFDEAQRAWTLEQTASFMRRKKNKPGFKMPNQNS